MGVVTATYTDAAPYTVPVVADRISYDVEIWTNQGPLTYLKVKPSHQRPPAVVNTIAEKPGGVIDWAMVNDSVYFSITEYPDMRICYAP